MRTTTIMFTVCAVLCTTVAHAAQVYYTWEQPPYVKGPDSVSSLKYYTYTAQAEAQKWSIKEGQTEHTKDGEPVPVVAEPGSSPARGAIRWVAYYDEARKDAFLSTTPSKTSPTITARFVSAKIVNNGNSYKALVRPTGEDKNKEQKYTAPGNGKDGQPLVIDNHDTKAREVTAD